MGESSLAAGVKHSCILLIIALIAFNFVLVVLIKADVQIELNEYSEDFVVRYKDHVHSRRAD